MKLFFQINLIRLAKGLCYLGIGQETASRWLTKTIIRAVNGLRHLAESKEDEDQKKREAEEQEERIARILAEREATPPDKFTIDLTTWKGDDGSPVVELIEITPDQLSALKRKAETKHLAVESLLSEAVQKAVMA